MVRAYVLITANPGKALDVVERLRATDGVIRADAITGEYDAIAEVQADDIVGVGNLVVSHVQSAGVLKTTTCLAVQ